MQNPVSLFATWQPSPVGTGIGVHEIALGPFLVEPGQASFLAALATEMETTLSPAAPGGEIRILGLKVNGNLIAAAEDWFEIRRGWVRTDQIAIDLPVGARVEVVVEVRGSTLVEQIVVVAYL